MSSIKNRIEYHGGAKLTNRARKAILTLPSKKKKKKRKYQNRKYGQRHHKRQDIFKKNKPVKGRKILRTLAMGKKKIH
jgi:hypothetical protein